MKPENAAIIEMAQINTSQGPSQLTKAWLENTSEIVSIWSGRNTPSPFLVGKKVGDYIRVVPEARESVDMNGNAIVNTRWTIIPDSPNS